MIGASMTTKNIRRTGIAASKKGKPNPLYPRHLIEVDDPYALEPGAKTVAERNIKNDPLANLHARKQIDEAQYHAGRAFQNDFETIQGHQQACDPSQPYVDQSFRHRGMSDAYSKAFARLNNVHVKLGAIGSPLIHSVLIDGKTMEQVARDRGLSGERWNKYYGVLFRQCLDCLALLYGFAMEKR
jgi:hypothetical protein